MQACGSIADCDSILRITNVSLKCFFKLRNFWATSQIIRLQYIDHSLNVIIRYMLMAVWNRCLNHII